MTEFIHFCDRCGRRIETGRTLATIEAGEVRKKYASVDLCATCSSEWVAWLEQGRASAAARSESSHVASSPSGPS